MSDESYRDRPFTIADADARLRDPADPSKFLETAPGRPRRIPQGTRIRIDRIREMPSGARQVSLFVHARSADGARDIGWTSALNLDGRFLSETLGRIEVPPGEGRFGSHAVWVRGDYRGQVALVRVFGSNRQVKVVSADTRDAFLALVADARGDGIAIGLNSGFRSYPEQKQLYDGYKRGLPGYNLAAKPGHSNHQNGVAFDFDVGGGGSNATYLWLQKHATKHGFVRTVKSEAWHWEYLPDKAARARGRGTSTTW